MNLSHLLLLLATVTANLQECTLDCHNGGQCVYQWQNAPHGVDAFVRVMACQCSTGYTGPNCEALISNSDSEDECSLECENGGECVFEWMASPRGLDGVMYRSSFMVCDCPEGLTGLHCEHEYETCPDGKMCLNGATCARNHDVEEESYRCDCSGAFGHSYAAGELCERGTTEFCDYGLAYKNSNFFCTNGGKCKRATIEENGTEHHSCECPKGFMGHHCEHVIDEALPAGELIYGSRSSPTRQSRGLRVSTASFVVLISMVCVVASLLVLFRAKYTRSQNSRNVPVSANRDHILDPDGSTMPTMEQEPRTAQKDLDTEII